MKYVEALLKDSKFLYRLFYLKTLEQNRVYCRHDLTHFLNTARIAWIFTLENGLALEKEQVYLAALLHDLGRVEEYEQEISHEEASRTFAGEILRRLGYDEKKAEEICNAVAAHRGREAFARLKEDRFSDTKELSNQEKLAEVLSAADQLSRNCFICERTDDCKWCEEEKTKGIFI